MKISKIILTILILSIIALVFSGCGGSTPSLNYPPVIYTLIANSDTLEVGQNTIITCHAYDQNGDTLDYTWTKTGGTISGSGSAVIWTAPATAGTYTIICVVSDGELTDAYSISIEVVEPESTNQCPLITSTAVTTATAGTAYTYAVTATDSDGDTLTYSLTAAPTGMTINSASGVITWTPTVKNTFWVAVKVSDGKLHDIQIFTITVAEANNAPVITSTAVTTATAGTAYTYTVTATDPDDDDTLTYSLTAAPTGMTINSATGAITWTPTAAGSENVIITVSDGTDSITQSFTITVAEANHPPVITSTAVTTATVGTAYTYTVTATDSDDGDTLTYSLTVAPTGMTINSATGVITWTPTTGQVGNNTVSLQVSDDGSPIEIDTQNFIVEVVSAEPNPIVRRALLVGVGDYQYFPDIFGNSDLTAPPLDVDMMHSTLNNSSSGFSSFTELKDLQASKTAILNGIATAFSEADSDDVSYFYFSGHGMNYEGISYLCPTDASYFPPLSSYVSTNELESALSAIPGTKVIFLDSCHSGGFIGKGKESENNILKEELINFNNDVVNVFFEGSSKGLLTTNQYKVLTSCHYYQVCYEMIPGDENSYGVFTRALCSGCGYYGDYFADSNSDNKVSLQEAYLYVIDWVYSLGIEQDVQIYPSNSSFTIID